MDLFEIDYVRKKGFSSYLRLLFVIERVDTKRFIVFHWIFRVEVLVRRGPVLLILIPAEVVPPERTIVYT